MAKTLIGNVKGKDGRGISKIEKTATTGAVDTYTITYTDSTQSTYEVRNSDGIAIQRQIVPSAAIESSTTATQSYAAGDYVVVDGALRKVKSAIANGNTISDSNSTSTTVGGELLSLSRDTGKVYLYNDGAWGSIFYRAKGGVCTLFVVGIGGIPGGMAEWRVPAAMPIEFLPEVGTYAVLCHRQSDHISQVWVPGKADEDKNLRIYSAVDTSDESTRINGIVSWVY